LQVGQQCRAADLNNYSLLPHPLFPSLLSKERGTEGGGFSKAEQTDSNPTSPECRAPDLPFMNKLDCLFDSFSHFPFAQKFQDVE
jgi:hypothetical protein